MTKRTLTPETAYRITESGCWEWIRARQSAGYGHFAMDGRWQLAHRWFYERAKGPIPAGLQLDHLCRNPACVNPDHLEAVTGKVNMSRGVNVGRPPTTRRLTTEEREEIKQRRAAGETTYKLAKVYGVSTGTVWRAGK